jgi:drug/metabolite transporter (DMT)-like permease
MNELLVATLAGLGGMFGWGLADLFAKKTIDQIGDITTLVVAHFFGTGVVILIVLYEMLFGSYVLALPSDAFTWVGLAFFGALQGLVYLLVYIGFGKGQVAVLNPIFSSFSGLVALVSIIFLGESVSPILGLGLLVAFAGIMLMNLDIAALRTRRLGFLEIPGFREVATATALATIWTLGWNAFVESTDWLSYMLIMYVAMTIALTLYALVKGVSLRVPVASAWKYLALIGLFESGAYAAISWGYSATSATSVVAVLSGAFSLPTIIGARVWLRERTTALQLWGSLGIVAGIVLVALA